MANTRVRVQGRQVRWTLTQGGVNSGDPCACGQVVGIALGPKDANNVAVIDTMGVYNVPVLGQTNGAVGSAVNQGDKLFLSAGNVVNKDTTGIFFGHAYAPAGSGNAGPVTNPLVASNATTTIAVRLAGSN